jgi:hypothetical protein
MAWYDHDMNREARYVQYHIGARHTIPSTRENHAARAFQPRESNHTTIGAEKQVGCREAEVCTSPASLASLDSIPAFLLVTHPQAV